MTFTFLPGLAEIVDQYDAYILDLWGVVHNGHAPYPGALDCMANLRKSKKQTILLSNAPRTNGYVVDFLKGIGVDRSAYEHILTSGDMTRSVLEKRDHAFFSSTGNRFYQIGATRDKGLDDGLDYIRVSKMADADFIICTGLVDDVTETPENYRELLMQALELDLPMFCANPDLTVMRGPTKHYCAGAIAALYEELGGRVALFGKPYAAAYRRTLQTLNVTNADRVLAIGDSMRTDIKGARSAGMDCVLVAGGIHAEEWSIGPGELPSSQQIEAVSGAHGFAPTYVMAHMVW
jgi:HAD superfamily hydrolase (TIGR01459 family)